MDARNNTDESQSKYAEWEKPDERIHTAGFHGHKTLGNENSPTAMGSRPAVTRVWRKRNPCTQSMIPWQLSRRCIRQSPHGLLVRCRPPRGGDGCGLKGSFQGKPSQWAKLRVLYLVIRSEWRENQICDSISSSLGCWSKGPGSWGGGEMPPPGDTIKPKGRAVTWSQGLLGQQTFRGDDTEHHNEVGCC